jgi:DNA invertase Pin-like site-specific DNA recombinase
MTSGGVVRTIGIISDTHGLLRPEALAALQGSDLIIHAGDIGSGLLSALAQFERRLIQDRTKAGLAAARARGRLGGRPKVTADEAKVVLAKKLHADKSLEIDDICTTLRISRSTLYRYARR